MYYLLALAVFILCKQYPAALWVLIPVFIYSYFSRRQSKNHLEDGRKIREEINNFVKDEVCSKSKVLYKKFESLSEITGYGLPPPEFASLIKDVEKRKKYCSMGIACTEAQLKSHKKWDGHSYYADFKIHTVISISIIAGAVVTKFYSLVVGVIVGALLYWLISEEVESAKVYNHFAETQAKPISDEWEEILTKFKKILMD